MSLATLERYDKCQYEETDFATDIAFAKDVQNTLGYKINAPRVVTEDDDAALLSALSKLDIKPFTPESILKYKENELNRHQRKTNFIKYSWVKTNIKQYQGQVPEFALQTALDIKKRCPNVEIFIDELVAQQVPTNDPFLVVKPNTKSYKEYYVEVWNEPRYRQERET